MEGFDWMKGAFTEPVGIGNVQPDAGLLFTLDNSLDTDPDAFGNSFSSSFEPSQEGFGPGDYSGGYTGEGDRMYWGAFDDVSTADGSNTVLPIIVPIGPVHTSVVVPTPIHSGGGIIVKQGGQLLGQDGGGGVASASTDTIMTLDLSSDRSMVIYPDGSVHAGSATSGVPSAESSVGATDVTSMEIKGGDAFSRTRFAGGIDIPEEDIVDPAGGTDVLTQESDGGTFDGAAWNKKLAPGWGKDVPLGDEEFYGNIGHAQAGRLPVIPDQGKLNAQEIFERYYSPDEPFNVTNAIMNAYDVPSPIANSEYSSLRGELLSLWSDANPNVELGDWKSVAETLTIESTPDLPGGDAGGDGGELQVQGDTPGGESAGTELSFEDSLTRGGIKPFVTPGGDEAPHLLGDLPDAPPNSEAFSWEAIDWNNVPDSFKADMSSYLSSDSGLDNSFLGSDGVGTNLGLFSRAGFANFLQSRMIDIGVGTVLAPLFKFIDDATDTPWVSRGIMGSLALYGLLAGGDPFGVIALPIIWGISALEEQAARKLSNEHPDANYGKQFGFVREGKKWYPAYLTRWERDVGAVGSASSQFSMSYGRSIKWKREKTTGSMIPYFDEGTYKQKNFHSWDDEVDTSNEMSGEKWRETADPLRDFYFLDEEETKEYFHNLGGGDTLAQYKQGDGHVFTQEEQDAITASRQKAYDMLAVHDDVSWEDTWDKYGTADQRAYYADYGQYVRTLQDLRSGFEMMQDYRTSEPGDIRTTRQDENLFMGSKWLRDKVNNWGYLGYQDQTKGQGSRPKGWDAQTMQDSAMDAKFYTDEGKYMLKQVYLETKKLYETQKRAGTSMKFGDIYGNSDAWRYYLDGTFEIGDTTTDDGLREALRHIEASGDSSLVNTPDYRNLNQRDYLSQKAWVRYLDGKLDQMGIADGWEMIPNWGDNNFNDPNLNKMELGGNFALQPTYSYADDFEKWGWRTRPTRDNYDRKMIKKYGGTSRDPGPGYWNDDPTMSADFAFDPERLRKAQEKPDWLRSAEANVLKNKPPPDMVAGRYKTDAEYQEVLRLISEAEGSGYIPPDEAAQIVEDLVGGLKHPGDPDVPEGVLPWDEEQRMYVEPGTQTEGMVYDPVTEQYHFPGTVYDPYTDKYVPGAVEEPDPEEDIPDIKAGSMQLGSEGGWGGGGELVPGVDYPDDFYFDKENNQVVSPDDIRFDPSWDFDLMWSKHDELLADAAAAEEEQKRHDDEAAAAAEDDKKQDEENKKKKKIVPDVDPTAGQHLHDGAGAAHNDPPDLPDYMQDAHDDLHFLHGSAPAHIPMGTVSQHVAQSVKTI